MPKAKAFVHAGFLALMRFMNVPLHVPHQKPAARVFALVCFVLFSVTADEKQSTDSGFASEDL